MPTKTSNPNNGVNNSIAEYLDAMSLDTEGTLKSIDLTLRAIARQDGILISQASLKDMMASGGNGRKSDKGAYSEEQKSKYSRDNSGGFERTGPGVDASRRPRKGFKGAMEDMEEQFSTELKKAIFGTADPIGDVLKSSLSGLANKLGTDVDHLGMEVGKRMGNLAGQALRNSKFGNRLADEWAGMADGLGNMASKAMGNFGDVLKNFGGKASDNMPDPKDIFDASWRDVTEGGLGEAANAAAGEMLPAVQGATNALVQGSTALGPALGGAVQGVAGLAAAFPWATAAILAAIVVIDKLSEAVGPAVEGFKAWHKALKSAANRSQATANKNLELATQRFKEDVEEMTKASFTVMEEAANKALSAWDNVSSTIAATQGYTKAGVQDLWSGFASRLKESGLSSYISSADLMENLGKVLESGLSGQVAEEFAYQATLLGKAIPTEDFFGYASTYASIAANAIKNGASQDEAIARANEELESFASNLLYASREIAGGFTTSLHSSAQELFESATKIAQTSRIGDVSTISGVLTSVSAIVGATAPDLASSVVDAVVNAAMGGNSSELTALRSMAGVGASNTAFLNALATDPQKVFTSLFKNLANMQGMSSANYMEVAEALSSVFGMSLESFARVDFSYLADAISAMNLENKSLEENMALLTSGETTSTAEQLRMQKVNEYMIDEGLAYVLDNEVARTIQQHMWEEQLTREIEENTFAVELTGATAKLLQGIRDTIQNIINILNPLSWMKKAANVVFTKAEADAQAADIQKLLKAGVVGSGSASALYNLTTRNANLKLTGSYLDMMGEMSSAAAVRDGIHIFNSLTDRWTNASYNAGAVGRWGANLADTVSNYFNSGAAVKSAYNTHLVSKSAASSLSSTVWGAVSAAATPAVNAAISSSMAQADMLSTKLNESIRAYTAASAEMTEPGENRDFNAWLDSFERENRSALRSQYGLNYSMEQVLTDYGSSIDELEQIYNQQEALQASAAAKAREVHEEQFWNDMQIFATRDFPKYLQDWQHYYLYRSAFSTSTDEARQAASDLKDKQTTQTTDTIYQLAHAILDSASEKGADVKDPALQTNILLAKILTTMEGMLSLSGVSPAVVPTSLTGLGSDFK